jgi:hypothetical protein
MAQLSMTVTLSNANVNLSTVGIIDWNVFAGGTTTASDWLSGGSHTISDAAIYGTNYTGSYTNDPRSISWTNGTNTPTNAGETDGVYNNNTAGNGFIITFPASTVLSTAYVYLGAYNMTTAATITAALSDATAGPVTDTTTLVTAASAVQDGYAFITYAAGSAGQSMTLTWYSNTASGNVSLQGAAIASASSSLQILLGQVLM